MPKCPLDARSNRRRLRRGLRSPLCDSSRVKRLRVPGLSLVAAIGLSVGCGGDKESSTGATAPAKAEVAAAPAPNDTVSAGDGSLTGMIAAAGGDAAVVAVIDDEGWTAVRERATALVDAGSLPAALVPQDGPGLIAMLAGSMDLEFDASSWKGRDAARPIVLSLYEPPVDGPPGVVLASMSLMRQHPPVLRHQILVPATDSAALVKSIRSSLTGDIADAPALVDGLAGAVGLSSRARYRGRRFIALVPESGHVRVVVLEAHGGADAAKLRKRIDVTPAPLPNTPALRHLAEAKHPVGYLARPWKVRALGVWSGMYEARRAVETVAADQRHIAMAKGTAIAAVAELLTPDDGAEFDDWSFVVAGDASDLRFTAVASLTPHGQKVWKAGTTKTTASLPLKTEVAGDVFVNLNVAAMVDAAGKHDLRDVGLSDLLQDFQMCGATCPTHLLFRSPMRSLATVLGVAGDLDGFENASVVSGLQLALVSKGSDLEVASALVGGSKATPAALREFAGVAFGRSASVYDVTRDGLPLTLVDTGADPREIFDTTKAGTATDTFATMRWGGTGKLPAPLKPTAMTGQMRYAGAALTSELVVGPGAVAFNPDYAGATWTSPRSSAAPTKEEACLVEAVRTMQTGFDAVATVSGDVRGAAISKTITELVPNLQCAAADAKLAGSVETFGDMAYQVSAEILVGSLLFDDARRLLTSRCPAGAKSRACERLATFATGAPPSIPTFEVEEDCHDYGGGLVLTVTDKEVALGGTAIADPDAKAVLEALLRASSVIERRGKGAASVDLVVDPTTPMKRVTPILEALAASNAGLAVRVKRADGGAARVKFALRWKPTTKVDWRLDASEEEWTAEDEIPEEESPEGVTPGTTPLPVTYPLKLDAKGMSVTAPGGSVAPVASIGQLVALAGRSLDLQVAEDVAWGEVLDVMVPTACSDVNVALAGP